jgi:hypothetical protein
VDELRFLKISPISSSIASCCRNPSPFHTTTARKRKRKQQGAAAIPEKHHEPLIEEGSTRFAGAAQPPPQWPDEKLHQWTPGTAAEHQGVNPPGDGKSGLIGDAGLQSPPMPHLLPLEEDSEEEEDAVTSGSAEGAR